MLKRLFYPLVVSLTLVCISPMDLYAPPQVPTPNGPGSGDGNPIDGGISLLLAAGAGVAFVYKKKQSKIG